MLKDKNIFLTGFKKRTINGSVLMENGSPAVNANISIDRKRENDGQKLRGGTITAAKSNANGEFSITVFEDSEYLIDANIWERVDNASVKVLYSSECFVIPQNGEVAPLKITLKKGSENCNAREFGF